MGGTARRINCGKCSITFAAYAFPNAVPDQAVEYTDGSGGFVMQGAGVVREDLNEHSGDNMLFQVLKHLPVFSGGNHYILQTAPRGELFVFPFKSLCTCRLYPDILP